MKVQTKLSTLKAATHCAATKDIRYYINGVLLQFQHGEVNSLFVVSTDGHHFNHYDGSEEELRVNGRLFHVFDNR